MADVVATYVTAAATREAATSLLVDIDAEVLALMRKREAVQRALAAAVSKASALLELQAALDVDLQTDIIDAMVAGEVPTQRAVLEAP